MKSLDGVWIAAAAFLLCAAFRQETLYGDAAGILLHNENGVMRSEYHVAYPWLLWCARAVGEPLGFTMFEVAGLLSAAGVAGGVLLAHAASRVLGLARGDAAAAALLVGVTPAAVFFGTVVEFHGPFLLFAGLAWVATARLIVRPGVASALLVGATSGFAYFGHATGFVIPGVVFPVAVAAIVERRRRAGEPAGIARLLALALPIAAVHLLLVYGGGALLRAVGLGVDAGEAQKWFETLSEAGFAVGSLMSVVFDEWLLPFVPASALALVGLALPRTRLAAVALHVGLVPYVVLVFGALAGRYVEHGAYLLPAALPAAWVAVRVVPRGRAAWLAPVGVAVGLWLVSAHDEPARAAGWGEGLRAVTGGRPVFLLIGDDADVEGRFVAAPDYEVLSIGAVAFLPREHIAPNLAAIEASLREHEARAGGMILTAGAEELLRHGADAARQALATDENPWGNDLIMLLLETRFELADASSGAFEGKWVRPR